MGPEALQRYINAGEAIKRLATSQGIDVLNLVKTEQMIAQEMQQMQAMQAQQSLVNQAGQFANTAMMDPEKNPEGTAALGDIVADQAGQLLGGGQPPQ